MNALFKALNTAPKEQQADLKTFKEQHADYVTHLYNYRTNPPATAGNYCEVVGTLSAIATGHWQAPSLYHFFSQEERNLAAQWVATCDRKIRELSSKNTCAKQLAILKNIRS